MSASIYSSKRSESSSREFVSRPHSSSHHFKGHINVRMEIGAQIAFRRRSSSDTFHSPPILGCNFIRLRISHHRKCFFAPEATKIQRKGHGGVVQSFMCVHLSLLQMYIMCGLVPSDVSSSSLLIRRRRESSRRPHIAASNEMAFLGALTREQNMHTRRISAKCTLQNAGPCGL
jgi:hypothetical protein